ncbi:hypothetical protein DFQ26_000123 [Actinomortierella ambigua]|nr:hypothetical protein DFQ26_000123 [Actinomortierella ambigua]
MPRLPAECVSLIVGRFVQGMTNIKSLHPLLLISRDFFLETVPYLYEDPFPHVKEKDQLALIALLLRCIPEKNRTQLLTLIIIAAQSSQDLQQLLEACQLTLAQMNNNDSSNVAVAPTSSQTPVTHKQQQPISPPTINYLSLIHKFGHKSLAELQDNAHVVHKLVESLTILRASPEIMSEMSDMYQGVDANRLRVLTLRPQLINELVWGLAEPYLEQVQSLLLPLSDVDRYLDPTVFHRLKSLATVTLYIDDRPEQRLASRYTQWIEFARRHTTSFPRVLRDIRWHRTAGRGSFGDPPPEIEDAWSRLLPPLDCPKRIDATNWKPMLKKWNEIDFSHCQEIVDPQRGDWPQTRILPKCRNLRRLTTSFNHPGAFRWAVEEKNALLLLLEEEEAQAEAEAEEEEEEETPAGGESQDDEAKPQLPKLVPLRMLNMGCTPAIMDQVMSAALDAFHDTLDSVRVLHKEYFTTAPFAVGEGWRAQKLKRLDLSTVSQGLLVNHDFFRQFEAIQDLIVVDKLYFYNPSTIRLGPTDVSLPHLVNLQLKGYTALAFPATVLSNTPNLEMLELGMVYRNGYHDISPVHPGDEDQEEPSGEGNGAEGEGNGITTPSSTPLPATTFLKSRGWTWDWSLPRLTKLTLSGDFAMRFRFKMLAGCPMLTVLSLSILTEGTAKRTICRADLEEAIDRVQQQQQQQQQKQECKSVVVLPHLEDLRMNGVWQFGSDRTYEMLMEKIIGTKLKEIIVYRCEQVPLETVVRLSHTKPLLRKVTMELAQDDQGALVDQERTARLGLKVPAQSRPITTRIASASSPTAVPAGEKCVFILGAQRYELEINGQTPII